MKKIMTPEVVLVNLDTNDILTTSLNVVDGGTQGAGINTAGAPARAGIFDAPVAAPENNGGIW